MRHDGRRIFKPRSRSRSFGGRPPGFKKPIAVEVDGDIAREDQPFINALLEQRNTMTGREKHTPPRRGPVNQCAQADGELDAARELNHESSEIGMLQRVLPAPASSFVLPPVPAYGLLPA
jgi:hypothetical protein